MLKKASRSAADMISREPRDRAQPGGHSVALAALQTPWLLRTQTLTPGWLRVTTWSSTLIVL